MELDNEVMRWSVQASKCRKIAESAPTQDERRKWLRLAYGCDDMAKLARHDANELGENGATVSEQEARNRFFIGRMRDSTLPELVERQRDEALKATT